MRRGATIIFLALLLFPVASQARGYEKWLIRTPEDVDQWFATGVKEGTLTPEGLRIAIEGQGVIFRSLPEGFHEHVDSLSVYVGPSTLEEVALMLVKTNAVGDIAHSFRLGLSPTESTLGEGEYVSLEPYRGYIADAEVFAVVFKGQADTVTFGGVRFFTYTPWEKVRALWRSFWTFEPFTSHTINILLGPVLTTDPLLSIRRDDWRQLSVSFNAYAVLSIALVGIALLVYATLRVWGGMVWQEAWRRALRHLCLAIAVVWVLYDARMGAEFLANVWGDHRSYVAASPETRTFRDRSRFYDFAQFVRGHVADRKRYELFLPDQWPYFGSMRYYTYPALPHDGEPVSDTWVVYQRPDVVVNEEGRLVHEGTVFTRPGTLLGQFDRFSFVFREQ